jgi:RNA polymerase sigma-70 factor (ECF subfamily)
MTISSSLHQPRSANALLVDRIRSGDADALGLLYDQQAPRLLRVAWRLVGERAEAEDVLHDLFVGLPEALRRYTDEGRLDAWLVRCVVRLSLMRLRIERRRGEHVPLDALLPSGQVSPALRAEVRELEEAIAALPVGLRTVFLLRQVEGFSHEEIAETLGISEGNSRVRLTRALGHLQQRLHVDRPSLPR